MPKLLEVIVTSVAEALEAELGGADRLEIVRSLEDGGFTPPTSLVCEIVQSVSIPVRVMLRENASMSVANASELKRLETQAKDLAKLRIEGVVLGFVKDGRIDLEATRAVLSMAPECRGTFHRAFESVEDSLGAIDELKTIPQIDRILTSGGKGSTSGRLKQLVKWQRTAAPEILILAGAGVCSSFLAAIAAEPCLLEVHVGRTARFPQSNGGRVDHSHIAAIKSALR